MNSYFNVSAHWWDYFLLHGGSALRNVYVTTTLSCRPMCDTPAVAMSDGEGKLMSVKIERGSLLSNISRLECATATAGPAWATNVHDSVSVCVCVCIKGGREEDVNNRLVLTIWGIFWPTTFKSADLTVTPGWAVHNGQQFPSLVSHYSKIITFWFPTVG